MNSDSPSSSRVNGAAPPPSHQPRGKSVRKCCDDDDENHQHHLDFILQDDEDHIDVTTCIPRASDEIIAENEILKKKVSALEETAQLVHDREASAVAQLKGQLSAMQKDHEAILSTNESQLKAALREVAALKMQLQQLTDSTAAETQTLRREIESKNSQLLEAKKSIARLDDNLRELAEEKQTRNQNVEDELRQKIDELQEQLDEKADEIETLLSRKDNIAELEEQIQMLTQSDESEMEAELGARASKWRQALSQILLRTLRNVDRSNPQLARRTYEEHHLSFIKIIETIAREKRDEKINKAVGSAVSTTIYPMGCELISQLCKVQDELNSAELRLIEAKVDRHASSGGISGSVVAGGSFGATPRTVQQQSQWFTWGKPKAVEDGPLTEMVAPRKI